MKTVAIALATAGFLAATPASHATNNKSIVDVAGKAGVFKTLLAAATAAGLADELDEVDGLTVFAPTDSAFAKLPAGTVENLLKPENKDTLRAIIAYHVLRTASSPGTFRPAEAGRDAERLRARARPAQLLRRDRGQGQGRQGQHRRLQRRRPHHRQRPPAGPRLPLIGRDCLSPPSDEPPETISEARSFHEEALPRDAQFTIRNTYIT